MKNATIIIALICLNGQSVYQTKNASTINLEHLTKGIYMLELVDKETYQRSTEMIIIQQ